MMTNQVTNISKNETMNSNTVLVIKCGDYDVYERTLVTVFQGLVNRSGPNVFILSEKTSWINTVDRQNDGAQSYPEGFCGRYDVTGTEGAMLDDFAEKYNLELKYVTLNEALMFCCENIRGLIEYDAVVKDENGELVENPARTNAIITASGIYDCLPVTPELLKKYPALENFEVVMDMRGKFLSRLQATQWAVDNLLEKCSTKFVSSYFYEGENGTLQNDYAVMNSAFCYELAAIAPEIMEHVLADPAISKDSFDLKEAELLDKILNHVEDFGFVWGWGKGGENGQASVTPLHGLELVCANMPNGSFYVQIKPERTDFRQPNRIDKDKVKVDNKFYIAFMTNEGDSYKAMASLQNYASWKQNARGKFPINWGIDPLVLDLFPSIADYYFSSATKNDYFFFAAAGYGYIHPDYLPVHLQNGYADLIKAGGIKYGVDNVDIWWFSMHDENGNEVQWDWLAKTGMRGLTLWNASNRTDFHNDIPVINSSLYYADYKIQAETNVKKAEIIAHSLINARKNIGNHTYCTVYYGGSPELFSNIIKNLPEEEFEVVSLQELFAVAEKSRESIVSLTAEYDLSGSVGAWDPTTA